MTVRRLTIVPGSIRYRRSAHYKMTADWYRRGATRGKRGAGRETKDVPIYSLPRAAITNENPTPSQKPNRQPRHPRHDDQRRDKGKNVGPDPPQRVVRRNLADRASTIKPDAEGRREQSDPHRQNDNDRIM